MKKMGFLLYKLFMIIYAVAILGVFICANKTDNELLLIVSSCLIGFLVIINLGYIIINKKRVSSVKLLNNRVTTTELHPLKLYIIDCLWNNRKKRFNKRQIYGAILYEIEQGNLVYTGSGIKLSSNINIDNLSVYSLITMEMSLLDRIGCRKARRLKMRDLKEIQKEDSSIIMEDLLKNINDNCQDVDLFNEQMNIIKAKHFREIEGKKSIYLSLVSWLCVISSLIFMTNNFKDGNVLNLYLPVVLAVFLAATLTSKYRERVVIQKDDKEYISNALNYIDYLTTAENTRVNEIYGYCLGKRESNLVSIFK